MMDIATRYRAIRTDYVDACRVDGTEDDAQLRLKTRLGALSEVERTILFLYADCGSYRKLGQLFGVSRTTMAEQVNRIKQKLTKL